MFAGKSQEINRRITLLDHYNTNVLDRIKYVILIPSTDTRKESVRPLPYKKELTKTVRCDNIFVDTEGNQVPLYEYDYIIIDEAQFLTDEAIKDISFLLQRDKYVLISGLDKDYKLNPFSQFMEWAVCCADEVTKLTGICSHCGKPSTTVRLVTQNEQKGNIIIESENNKYIPLCRKCYNDFSLESDK